MGLTDERYVAASTDRKSGDAVTCGGDFDAVPSKVRAKYGAQVARSGFFNVLGHIGKGEFPYGDVVVLVTPVGGAPAS